MIKAPIGLQELRRRIYRKAKSDKTHRKSAVSVGGSGVTSTSTRCWDWDWKVLPLPSAETLHVKAAATPDRTHNPSCEASRVSCLRENLTSSSDGEGLETGRGSNLVPRQSFTRQVFVQDWKTYEGWGALTKQPGEEGSSRSLILSLLVDHCLLLHPAQLVQLNHRQPAYTVGSLIHRIKVDSLAFGYPGTA